MTDRRLNLLYVHDTSLGYARYGTKLAEALIRAGVKVDDQLDPDHRDPSHLVCWVSTPVHASGWFDGQHPVISTMWESDTIPESFREGIHNFAQVLVPSEQNVELFSRYHPNVVKVPLGVDSEDWAFRKRTPPTTDFRFLIGGSGSRKGLDLAYKAFRKVFQSWPRDMPRPVLQFKSPRPCEFVGERIEHIGGRISDQAERDLYGAAHCYLQPSRGEGFGLQPLQAIAQGLPTVLTDAHGQAEFARLGYGISATKTPADYFMFGDAGSWWEPDLDELCAAMEYVYYNYDAVTLFARESSEEAHEQYNWDVVADNFQSAIGPEHFTTPYTGSRAWLKPDLKRYLVTVDRPWAAWINNTRFQWMPGQEYYEPADVKRILWEADVLDPGCVQIYSDENGFLLESGLTDKQLAGFGDYSGSHSYCHHCHQKLGTGELYDPPE